jgi:rhodanese-related sulfurtransferase
MEQISPVHLKAWLDDAASVKPLLLDVREPREFAICHIDGATPMPMASVPACIDALDAAAPTVVICHHGMRSMQVAMYLQQQGFSKIYNLGGGVAAWAAQVDPAMPTY